MASAKKAPMGWGKRIETAILVFQSRLRERVTLERFGELVAKAEGRKQPYGKATVSAWVSETNEPYLKTFAAMAKVAGGDPWWFTWGVGRAPDNPIFDAMHEQPRRGRGGEDAMGL